MDHTKKKLPLLLLTSFLAALLIRAGAKEGREGESQGFLGLCRTTLVLPMVIPAASMVLIWKIIFCPDGVLNQWLSFLTGKIWETDWAFSGYASSVLAATYLWKHTGYDMVLWLAGLMGISRELYEAAEMDHASGWQKFKDITLPELKPLCVFVFITVTIGAFRMIVQPMVMTGGGPSHSTYTMVYNIYETGTVNWEIGLASTMAIVFAIFVMALTVIQSVLTRDKEERHVNKKTKKG